MSLRKGRRLQLRIRTVNDVMPRMEVDVLCVHEIRWKGRFKTGGHWARVHFKLKLEVAKGERRVYKGLEMKGGREGAAEFGREMDMVMMTSS